eukprot:scaffold208489_cov39-Tisochrysis_lutea.AAC.5
MEPQPPRAVSQGEGVRRRSSVKGTIVSTSVVSVPSTPEARHREGSPHGAQSGGLPPSSARQGRAIERQMGPISSTNSHSTSHTSKLPAHAHASPTHTLARAHGAAGGSVIRPPHAPDGARDTSSRFFKKSSYSC